MKKITNKNKNSLKFRLEVRSIPLIKLNTNRIRILSWYWIPHKLYLDEEENYQGSNTPKFSKIYNFHDLNSRTALSETAEEDVLDQF